MLTLAIDTSTPAVTAGLFSVTGAASCETVSEQVVVDARGHGEQLAPLIDAALAEAGAKPSDLAAVVAGLGPGPFTGLRVGLVTAAAMSDALGIPSYGVCSLDAIGWAAASQEGPLLAATDARRKEIYWAVYDAEGERTAGPQVSRPAELPPEAKAPKRTVGDGAHLYAGILGQVEEAPRFPPAAALAFLASYRVFSGAPTEVLTPLYLRRPDVHIAGQQQRAG